MARRKCSTNYLLSVIYSLSTITVLPLFISLRLIRIITASGEQKKDMVFFISGMYCMAMLQLLCGCGSPTQKMYVRKEILASLWGLRLFLQC